MEVTERARESIDDYLLTWPLLDYRQ